MVDKILGAHPVNDSFWYSTNPTDISIDTVNSEEKMTGSHITEFYTHKDEQPGIADLLSQEDQDFDIQHDQQLMICNVENLLSQEVQDFDNQNDPQLMTCKHDTGLGHHNPSDPQFTTPINCKLATDKDASFPLTK